VLAYRSANKDVRYTLANFLEMRRNVAAYSVFYSTFIPTMVGRSLMKKLVEDDSVLEEISTISDEALALLALENGVNRWDDVFTRRKGDVRPFPKDQEIPKEFISTVQTKYTVSSSSDAVGETEGREKRWSKDGIIRFNQLRQMVIKDRAAHPEFIEDWLQQQRDAMATGPSTASKTEANTVDADDDFGSTPAKMPGAQLKKAAQSEDVVDEDDSHSDGDGDSEAGGNGDGDVSDNFGT
jgi:hypothetical protein